MIKVKLREMMDKYSRPREEKLTYQQLAEMTGISKATLETIGSRSDYNPTLSIIDTLCEKLECSVEELLEHTHGLET